MTTGDAVVALAIAAIAAVPGTLTALFQGRKTYRLVNGRMRELMRILHKKAKLEGYEEGIKNRHIRKDDIKKKKRK